MSKLPSLQFYPGDWLRDQIAGCSLEAQGLWLRIMFLMHDSPRYGYLVTKNGSPIPSSNVAQSVGLTSERYETLLAELDSVHVPSRTAEGVIFSRRMVRDSRRRAQWRKSKKAKSVTVIPHQFHTNSTPSSSSSSYFIKEKREESAFDSFWEAYPKKIGRQKARMEWGLSGCDSRLGEVLASLTSWRATEQWKDFQYIPYPATWIREGLWKENPRPEKQPMTSLVAQKQELERKLGIA